MKIPHFCLLALLLTAPAVYSQTSTSATYSEAQRAYLSGDTKTAKEKFEKVLAAEPEHPGAKNYMKSILAAEKKDKKSTLSTQLATLIVPKVTFKEASFGSVLDYLKVKAAELSANKITPSFVLQLPPDFAEKTPITLDLSNVPFTEVLRYLGELTSTKFEIQQYAIVVSVKS
ncbi:MAG: hypothetical protein ABIT76_01965 [Chthoniobacterales bacterium]